MATAELTDLGKAQADGRDMVRTYHKLQVRMAERKLLNQAIVQIEKEIARREKAKLPYQLGEWDAAEFVNDVLSVGLGELIKSISKGELTAGK